MQGLALREHLIFILKAENALSDSDIAALDTVVRALQWSKAMNETVKDMLKHTIEPAWASLTETLK